MPIFENPSLLTRIGVGKAVGLIFGLIGFVSLPYLAPTMDPMVRWGILFWYPTVGAMIGLAGVYTRHPVLHLPMPWWLRSSVIGCWMNFVLTLFAYDSMATLLTEVFGVDGLFVSPFWFVVEGGIIGLVIGAIATKLGGEGRATTQGVV